MKKMSQEISQEELTAKTLRRIYNRGKRKGKTWSNRRDLAFLIELSKYLLTL